MSIKHCNECILHCKINPTYNDYPCDRIQTNSQTKKIKEFTKNGGDVK